MIRSMYLALVAAFLLATLPARAVVVTTVVTPNPQPTDTPVGLRELGETTLTNGWMIATNAKGWAKLSTFGPSTSQSRTGPLFAHYLDWYNDAWYPDTDFGRGTFTAECDMWIGGGIALPPEDPNAPYWKTPSTCWLGTDTYQGTPIHGRTLGSITKMEYYSFVDKIPTKYAGGRTEQGWWAKANWWGSVQQPIQIHLVVTSPDGTENRQLWYRPWGGNFVGDDGILEPGSQKGRWQLWNCLTWAGANQSKWYMPLHGDTPNTVEQGWAPTGSGSTAKSAWENMLDFQLPQGPMPPFREWTLAENVGKNPGWNKNTTPQWGGLGSTGTGYSLNFFVGARINGVKPLWLQSDTASISWYNHANGERAQVDMFTLGFSGEGQETFDFEPALEDLPVRTVAMSEKSLKDPIMGLASTKRGILVKVTGQVAQAPSNAGQGFVIEDGSKLQYLDLGYDPTWLEQVMDGPVRVFLPDDIDGDETTDRWAWNGWPLWVSPGDIVSVVGMVEPFRFPGAPSDHQIMWTNVYNIKKLQNF